MSDSRITAALSQIKDLVNSDFEGLVCCEKSNIIYEIWTNVFLPTELQKDWNLALLVGEEKSCIYLVRKSFGNVEGWGMKYSL